MSENLSLPVCFLQPCSNSCHDVCGAAKVMKEPKVTKNKNGVSGLFWCYVVLINQRSCDRAHLLVLVHTDSDSTKANSLVIRSQLKTQNEIEMQILL